MKILAIETSCDETGISIINAEGSIESSTEGSDSTGGVSFNILADTLASQAKLHSEYGGVYPTLAKREHIKALPILLDDALQEAGLPTDAPELDAIAVTHGPGLEPALWTGITFAQELSAKWNVPIVPVNHMEGHIYSTLIAGGESKCQIINPQYPAIALLISGGHTDMILIKEPMQYEYLGGTLDDAVGEAYDKAARMLGLGYPGGPAIDKLTQEARDNQVEPSALLDIANRPLPRPMLHSGDFNFSFSGLKTAVLYKVKEIQESLGSEDLPIDLQRAIARNFQEACTEVLSSKVSKAMQEYSVNSLIIAGGVAASSYIVDSISKLLNQDLGEVHIHTPYKGLSGDNAMMIAIAGYLRALQCEYVENIDNLKACGTLKL